MILHDGLRLLLLDADLDVDRLLHLRAADLLDLLRVKEAGIDPALGALGEENVGHLIQLELVVGVERHHELGLLDARVRALEVEAVCDFLVSTGRWRFFSSTLLTSETMSKEGMAIAEPRDYTGRMG